MSILVGIDWSLRSPAICVWDGGVSNGEEKVFKILEDSSIDKQISLIYNGYSDEQFRSHNNG